MLCQEKGCEEAARPTFANCDGHTLTLVTRAFRPGPSPLPQSWHARARLGLGRTSVVGGVALEEGAAAVPVVAPSLPATPDPGDHHIYA